ncbi:ABC transporter permease [Dyadobacter sp. NIV53]|uniref:ABC transporter permease n=1 Tax=Dyadobacter sp. NIV53 TaxID=2861765 RepID=UPI001C86F9BA|nr:ABC transporter permease [Dyadobacter sp. NIV53]
MFQIYLKIARRHLWQSRLYACINVAGLAVGLTCVLLAALFIKDERSFDQFHSPDLYRINSHIIDEGKTEIKGGTGQVQGPAFKSQVPEVLNFARILGGDIREDVRAGDKAFRLQLLFVDDTFFDVFNFKLKEGNAKTVLKDINSVVITEQVALKFFGHTDVVGQTLQMDYEPSARRVGRPLVVTGVVENPPSNSSVQFGILFPFKLLQLSFDDPTWLNGYLGTFVVLHPKADIHSVEQKFNKIHRVHAQDQLAENKRANGSVPSVTYRLQRITDIHLNPQNVADKTGEDGVVHGSKLIYSYLFLGIASFILLMASINFININIANSMKRAKEIGVRKVTGGSQSQILLQFLGESGFLCALAFLLSLVITFLILPVFNQLSGKHILFNSFLSFAFLSWSFVIIIVNVFISGFYPAFLLSQYDPVQVLYQRHKSPRRSLLSTSLVTFQFSIAVLLGICTMIFYQQMNFVKNKDLGYNPGQVIRIKIPGLSDTKNMSASFKAELKDDAHIQQLSVTGEFGSYDTKVNGRFVKTYYRSMDADYLPVLGIRLKEGRNFSTLFPSDKKYGIIVNEAFIKAAKLINPLGAKVNADPFLGKDSFTIIGVVKNFHTGSFREAIRPMLMFTSEQYGGEAILTKIDASAQTQILGRLKNTFQKLIPGAAFDFAYLDEQNANEYEQELRWQKIITYATALSIFICCMGLFALVHLSVSQRMRETGIRVVLGATALDIVSLFSKDFLKLVLVAVIVASPLAYYLMNYWLANFVYRINIEWWVFALSGCISVLITLLTVGSQALKSALMNPTDALRIGVD